MHQTQFSEKIPYGGFSQIRSQIVIIIKFNDELLSIHYDNNIKLYIILYAWSVLTFTIIIKPILFLIG